MLNILILILLVVILLAISFLWLKLDQKNKASRVEGVTRNPKPGECPHTSSARMKVTSMGDREDYYLCKLCNKKVKASELYYFEKGGI